MKKRRLNIDLGGMKKWALLGMLLPCLSAQALTVTPFPLDPMNPQVMDEDTTLPLSFIIGDTTTVPTNMTVTVSSCSIPALLTDSGLVPSGSGANLTISLTPEQHENGANATITLLITDTNSATDFVSFVLTVTPVDDPPTFTGSLDVSVGDNAASTNPYVAVAIVDPDHNRPDPVTLNVTMTFEENVLVGEFDGISGIAHTFFGSPDEVTAELAGLEFAPFANRMPVGDTDDTIVEIEVTDGTTPVTRNSTLSVLSINDAPSLTASTSPSVIDDTQTVQPFSVTIYDPDVGESFTATMVAANDTNGVYGTLSSTSLSGSTELAIQSAARAINYVPNPNVVAGSEDLDFNFSVVDAHSATSTATARLTVNEVSDPPAISGVNPSLQRTTDAASITPFPTVTITDPDQQGVEPLTVVLEVSDPAFGSISPSNTTIPADQVTAWINAVEFVPEANSVPVGATETVSISITVTDTASNQRNNENTEVAITGVNGAPQFSGVPSGVRSVKPTDPRPFDGMTISDDDTHLVLAISLDTASKGSLSNTTAEVGFSEVTSGTYEFAGNEASISNLLNGLEFIVNESYAFSVGSPGDTTFTLTAEDDLENEGTATVQILLEEELQNFVVTHVEDDMLNGSLRYAVDQATAGDHITFALPEYPALIRLTNVVSLTRHVTLKGPGADLLRISGDSDGDGEPDTQLFQISATVVMEGITFESGTAQFGGALRVNDGAGLTLRSCVVKDSIAQQWGGGIDVEGGALMLERCLIQGNRTDSALGQGGGGVSIYSDMDCSIENTTFAGNHQEGASSSGGGALFVENSNPQTYLDVELIHCTFAENSDAAIIPVSALSVNAQGARVYPLNTIFADGAGRNLQAFSGVIDSQGGNLSDDSTAHIGSQQGQPDSIYFLDDATDQTDVATLNLGSLTQMEGHTAVYPLLSGSAAIDAVQASVLGADQRGVHRSANPDSGAVEFDAVNRVVINEIQTKDTQTNFIEFYVPRDSLNVDLDGYQLFVDGMLRHTFAATDIVPGSGIILADAPIFADGIPVVTPSSAALDLGSKGTILLINAAGQLVELIRYVDVFPDLSSLTLTDVSLTLVPQFGGAAYLPHTKALAPPFGGWDASNPDAAASSPGKDTANTTFGADNAVPVAIDDEVELSEDMLTQILVLANDLDADRADVVVLTGLTNANSGTTALGADYWVKTNDVTGYGASVMYDPRTSTNFDRLPDGAEVTDSFDYKIKDVGSTPIGSIVSAAGGVTVTAEGHRLSNGDSVQIFGTSDYDGTYVIANVTDDAFDVSATYVVDESAGTWIARSFRGDSDVGSVEVTIIGANDFPVGAADAFTCNEEEVFRILADPDSGVTFTDAAQYPVPVTLASGNLLLNDSDIDTDDDNTSLLVVGVLDEVFAISSFSGTEQVSPVTVHSVSHGLTSGDLIVISGYGGHPSYNGEHAVTVLDADSFTIPVVYVDDAVTKGIWGRLNDGSRLEATSSLGASVALNIRVDREETHLIYNPRGSAILNAISLNSNLVDRFYYAVADSHDALSIGQVDITVIGLNELPAIDADPDSLTVLDSYVSSSNSLSSILQSLRVVDAVGAASGGINRADVRVDVTGTNEADSVVITDAWFVKETDVLSIALMDLLANDSDEDSDDVLFVSSVFDSDQGVSVTLGADVQYDAAGSDVMDSLAQGEQTLDFFRAVVSDGAGGFVTNVVAVVVEGVNDTPVSFDDRITIKEDAVPFTFDPRLGTYSTTNDYDVDINGIDPDNELWVLSTNTTMSPREAYYFMTNNSVTYQPALSTNEFGYAPGTSTNYLDGIPQGKTLTDHFEYTISDQSFIFAENDFFRVAKDGSNYVIQVLENDRNYNVRTGALHIATVGVPDEEGAVTITDDSTTLTYSPKPNFVGNETFTYMVEDPWGNMDKARVTLRVTEELFNGALQVNHDAFSVAWNETVTLDVLANDNTLPNEGSDLFITRVLTNGTLGSVELVGNQLRYTQTNAAVNADSFQYEIKGRTDGTAREIATVTIEMVNRSGKIPAQNDFFTVGFEAVDQTLDVTANDYIFPTVEDHEIVSIDSTPQGTVTINTNDNTLTYSAKVGFVGRDRFGYTVSDHLGGTGSGTITVYVGALTATDDFYTLPISNGTFSLNVLSNDRNFPGVSGSISLGSVSPLTSDIGTISVVGDQLSFVANGTAGSTNFTYVITDGNRTAEATVMVKAVTDALYGNADVFHVLSDSEEVTLDVLNNDSSLPDVGRPMTIQSLGTGSDAPNQGGTVVVSANNQSLIYTPVPGFVGEEAFTYTVTDSRDSNEAKVVVKVGAPIVAVADDRFAVFHEAGDTPSFTLPVLGNDTFLPDRGGLLTVMGTGFDTNVPSQSGSIEVAPNGQDLIYQPDTNYAGVGSYTENITYEVSDGTDARIQGLVQITVYPRSEGRLPACNADAYSVARNSRLNTLPVLGNDGVLPGGTAKWTITSVSTPAFAGMVSISGTNLIYSPKTNFFGTETFDYTVNDGLGSVKSATVTVQVGSLLLNEDEAVVVSGTQHNEMNVLLNDGVQPGPEFALLFDTNAVSALIGDVSATTNHLYYTPSVSYAGVYPYVDTVLYGEVDHSGLIRTQTVSVKVIEDDTDLSTSTIIFTVEGVNDLPVIGNLQTPLATDDKTSILPFPTGAISDVDEWGLELLDVTVTIDDPVKGSLISLGAFTNSAAGVYQMSGTGPDITASFSNLLYVPVENRITIGTTEIVTFTIEVLDPFITNAVTADVDVVVTPINDVPVITGTRADQTVYHALRIKPFSGVTITEVDDLTVQPLDVQIALDIPTNGTLTSLGEFVDMGAGVYLATNVTAAQANASLRSLFFEPTTNGRLSLTNGFEVTRFTVSVDDQFAPPVTDAVTTVMAMFGLMNDVELWLNDRPDIREFGSAVGALRDWVVSGAHDSNVGGDHEGAVLLYSRNLGGLDAWGEYKVIVPQDASGYDEFGYAVVMSGDTLVVGAPSHEDKGAVYVYQQNRGGSDNWGLVKKIQASDGVIEDFFGCSVAIDADTIAVGDKKKEKVYLFDRHDGGSNEWGQVQIVEASDNAEDRDFGHSVSLYGNALVVGAPYDDTDMTDDGAAYLFEQSGGVWLPQQKLYGDGGLRDYFGWSVDVYADLLVVGSPRDNADDSSLDMGAAFIFVNNGIDPAAPWASEKKLVASTRRDEDYYGAGVRIDRGLVVVGVENFQIGSSDDGEAYLYGRHEGGTNQWGEIDRFTAPARNSNGTFGRAMALENYTLAIGSTGGGAGLDTLSIYRLRFNDAPVVTEPISDQVANLLEPFNFTVPKETFTDPDIEDAFVYSATLADGSSLNTTWLSFDSATRIFSGTPSVTGVVEVLVMGTDLDDLFASDVFAINVVSTNGAVLAPLDQWKIDNFGANPSEPKTGDAEDYDDDGRSNLEEYLFGSDPDSIADGSRNISIVTQDQSGQLTISYIRRTDDPSLTYWVESSSGLVAWVDAGAPVQSDVISLLNGTERVTLVFNTQGTKGFLRVKVSY